MTTEKFVDAVVLLKFNELPKELEDRLVISLSKNALVANIRVKEGETSEQVVALVRKLEDYFLTLTPTLQEQYTTHSVELK